MQKPLSDETLLDRIRQGDKSACDECIERHSPGVHRLALRLTQDESEADDVVQETFLQAFRAIDSFEGRSTVRTWLYRIAYNAVLMRRRDAKSAATSDLNLEDNGASPVPKQLFDWCCLPEEDFQTKEVQMELNRAINDLPETLRVVFVLRELEGLSTDECAASLDISIDVVKQRLHRARLRLRERLSGYFNERLGERKV